MIYDPYTIEGFLKAHNLTLDLLITKSGRFRSGDVGLFDGAKVIHIGASPMFVAKLVVDLFQWAQDTALHPIIKSPALHYEIVIIPSPTVTGVWLVCGNHSRSPNGTLFLSGYRWHRPCTKTGRGYYQAIADAKKSNDSAVFIEFTLSAVVGTIKAQEKHQVERQDKHQVVFPDTHLAISKALKTANLSRKEIIARIGMCGDSRSFNRNVAPLLSNGLIEMTVPDKPNSRLQKYRLTDIGKTQIIGDA
jgi:Fic family protein